MSTNYRINTKYITEIKALVAKAGLMAGEERQLTDDEAAAINASLVRAVDVLREIQPTLDNAAAAFRKSM